MAEEAGLLAPSHLERLAAAEDLELQGVEDLEDLRYVEQVPFQRRENGDVGRMARGAPGEAAVFGPKGLTK